MLSQVARRCLTLALLCCSGSSLVSGYTIATAADAVQTPMTADKQYPQLSREISSTRLFAPELGQYVDNPQTTCTIFAPDNKAITTTMDSLGQYVGLFIQNKTLQEQLLNYHVVPNRKITAQQLGSSVLEADTRANETVAFVQHNGQPYVSFGRKYVVPIKVANIQAGGCIMHIITNTVLAPPSVVAMIEGWLAQAGNLTALQAPQQLWLPASAPQPGPVEDQPEGIKSAAATSPAAEPTAAPAPAAATSGAAAGKKGSGVAAAVCLAAAGAWVLF
eukprot:GHUV01002581.1.p1 GENE.GHUV01002581.1~~GHUV01002581.1.p1  ORF type:complete len:276 (+),score=75.39 GHUV01002581.1:202-1029(+)